MGLPMIDFQTELIPFHDKITDFSRQVKFNRSNLPGLQENI